MHITLPILLLPFAVLPLKPLHAQDPPADFAQEIAQMTLDDARCSDPADADYAGEWCKGFRTGATFINMTSSCGYLIDGPTMTYASEMDGSDILQETGPGEILFEQP